MAIDGNKSLSILCLLGTEGEKKGKGREGKGREGKGRVLASLFQPCWCHRNGFPSVFLLVHVRVAEEQKAVEVCAC